MNEESTDQTSALKNGAPATIVSLDNDTLHAPAIVPPATLVGETRAIAVGVQSIAKKYTARRSWLAWVGLSVKYIGGGILSGIGALFAMETFFQHQQESYRNQADNLFSSVRQQLGSDPSAICANAIRQLPLLAKFENITQTQPSEYYLGSHLLNRFWYKRTDQPLKRQCWMLFREFAQQRQAKPYSYSVQEDIVSSALLREGVAWERKKRFEKDNDDPEMSGSMLFNAKLSGARGNDLDCSGILFGAVELKFANLQDSKFDDANLVLAVIDGAVLNNVSFKSASLAEASAVNADFSFASCNKANFRKATIAGAVFKETSLEATDFTNATLDRASFNQAILRDTIFTGASLRGAVFSQTDVSSASFDGADVDGTDFIAAIGVTKALLSKARNSDKAILPIEKKAP